MKGELRAAWATTTLLCGCAMDLGVPEDAQISCVTQQQCPTGFRCREGDGVCVPNDEQDPPKAAIVEIARAVDDIPIHLQVFGAAGQTISLDVDVDLGQGWEAADDDDPTVVVEGGATAATVTWHAGRQRGGDTSYRDDVRVRVTPSANTIVGDAVMAEDVAIGDDPPRVTLEPIGGVHDGNIAIAFTLQDSAHDRSSIQALFRLDPSDPWRDMNTTGSTTADLATSLLGEAHTVFWVSDQPLASGGTDLARYEEVAVRLIPSNTVGGITTEGAPVDSLPFVVDNTTNNNPWVTISTPVGISAGEVAIAYVIHDIEGDLCTVQAEYSIQGGAWAPITLGSSGEGATDLASSREGTPHVLAWDTLADGVAVSGLEDTVRIRLAATGTSTGGFAESDPFSVDNSINNASPGVSVASPSETGGLITLSYTLTDAESDAVDIEVEVLQTLPDGWVPALQAGGDGTVALATSPSGASHTFVWSSVAQGTAVSWRDDVQVRIRAHQRAPAPVATSPWGYSAPFVVDNGLVLNRPPAVQFDIPTRTWIGAAVIDLFYTVSDPESDTVDLDVEFSVDGGLSWGPATTAARPDDIVGLSSSPEGRLHVLSWDAVVDTADRRGTDIRLRVTPFDGYHAGPVVDVVRPWKLPATHPTGVHDGYCDSSEEPVLLVDNRSGVHLFWVHDPTGTNCATGTLSLTYRRSDSWGETWTTESSIVPGTVRKGPGGATDGERVLLAYTNFASSISDMYVVRSPDRGRTWGTPVNVSKSSPSTAINSMPHLAIGPNGDIHMVWSEVGGGGRYAYSQTAGNWSTPVYFSTTPEVVNPTIIIEDDGTRHIMWAVNPGASPYPVLAARSADGVAWSVEAPYDADASISTHPDLVRTVTGKIVRFWGSSTGPRIAMCSDGSCDSPRAIPGVGSHPVAVLDNQGAWHVVSRTGIGFSATLNTVSSVDGGLSWSDSRLMGTLNIWTDLALDPTTGIIHYAAAEGLSDLVTGNNAGDGRGIWAPPRRLAMSPNLVEAPSAATGPDGAFYVLWRNGARLALASTTNDGTTWDVRPDATSGSQGRIVVAPNGTLHVSSYGMSGFPPRSTLYHRTSANGGDTWVNHGGWGYGGGILFGHPTNERFCVVVDSQGNAFGVRDDTNTLRTVRAVDITGNSSTNLGPDGSSGCALAIDDADTLYALYGTLDGGAVYFRSNLGAGWTNAVTLPANAVETSLTLAAQRGGDLAAGWIDASTGEALVSRSEDGGDSWSTPEVLEASALTLALEVDSSDRLHAAWVRSDGVVFSGVSWDAGVQWNQISLLDGAGTADTVALATSPGTVHVAWPGDGGLTAEALSYGVRRSSYRFDAPLTAPVAVPGGGTASSTMLFSHSLTVINNLTVMVDLTHPDLAEVTILLTHTPPLGTPTASLLWDHGPSRASTRPMEFLDGAPLSPYETLDIFSGRTMSGTWELTVTSDGNPGTLRGWTLAVR